VRQSASSLSTASSESILPKVSASFEDASIKVKEAATDAAQAVHDTIIASPSKRLVQAASDASQVVPGSTSSSAPGMASKASERIESIESAISEALPVAADTSSTVASSATRIANTVNGKVESASNAVPRGSSHKVFAGASAQQVSGQQPILDDVIVDTEDGHFSEKMQRLASEAGDRLAEVTRAVSEALLKPTPTQGSVESITSLASEQYSSAIAAASSVLYGTPQGTGESIASVASSQFAQAVSA
jgi:hypothetical protein